MKKFLLILISVFFYTGLTFGQLSGTYYIPSGTPSYPTIQAAVTDLNTLGCTGGVTFLVAAGYTENITAPITITATGAAGNVITFQKDGAGTNPLVTRTDAGSLTTSAVGGAGDAIFRMEGTDYITFDGIDASAGNSGIEYGYLTHKPSGTDGCQYVTIQNCVITLTKGTSGYVMGIYIGNGTISVSSAVGVTVTASSGINSNITINGNTVQNVHAGVYVRGSSATGFYDSDVTVGQTGAGNTIQNFGGGSATTTYGVYFIYVNNPSVAYNIINNAGGGGGAHGSTLYGIFYSTVLGTVVGSNNAFTLANTAASSATQYIYNTNTVTSENYSNNTFAAGTISSTGTVYLIYASSATNNKTISGNSVSGTITRTGASGSFYCYYNLGGPTGGTETFSNNNFSNIGVTGSSSLYGFYSNTAVAQNRVSYNNTISNWVGGTGSTYCIYHLSTTSNQIYNNNIYNIASGGALYGLYFSGTNPTVYNNNVYNLATTGTSMYGIYDAGTGTTNCYKNRVYNLTGSNASQTLYGFYITTGTSNNVYNNFISDLKAPNSASLTGLVGMYISGGTAVGLYYNTIYLNATSIGANFTVSGIYASTTPTVDLRNNIVVNASTPNGTGFAIAYRRSTTTLTSYSSNSNFNDFYAGTPSATNLIFYDGTNSDQTLAAFKTRVAPRDASSVTELPPFVNIAATPYDLHINPAIPTLVESAGANVAGITDDYDAQVRQGNGGYAGTGIAPDIGADEFEGTNPSIVALDMGATALVAPAALGCYTSAETVTVTIKNFGTALIDFTVNPTTVTTDVTGAVTQTLNATVNSGTLASGSSTNVNMSTTLDMTTTGTYTFNAYTTVTGDGNAGNDAMSPATRSVSPTVSLSQTVDFTGFTGADLTTWFPNWYEAAGTTPSGTTSLWLSQTGLGGTGNITARVNLYTTSRNEWIVGPKFTATSLSQLKFKAAVTNWNSITAGDVMGADDKVRVMISTDCGASWSSIYQLDASFALTITLTEYSVPLGTYNGQNVILAFYATDGPIDNSEDYDFHIDDIIIENASSSTLSWYNLQWPPTASIDVTQNATVYAQCWESGVTEAAGPGTGIECWIGYNTSNSNPNTWTNWVTTTYNYGADPSNNDEYMAGLGVSQSLTAGTYYYASRWRYLNGPFTYGGYNGGAWDGTTNVSGVLTVNPLPNDLCSGAITVTCGNAFSGTTNTATPDTPGACNVPNYTYPGVWYHFAGIGDMVSVDLCTGTTWDAMISVYQGTCASLVCVDGNDDYCSLQSRVDWFAESGTDYYLLIHQYGATGGAFTLTVNCTYPPTATWQGDDTSPSAVDWFGADNWDGADVPGSTTDVIIPTGLTNYPTVDRKGTCNNISIASGARLVDMGTGYLIPGGTATVDRDYSGGEWHLISAPISNATANMFLGLYLQKHTESTNLYTDIYNTATPLNVMQGYALWNDLAGTAQFVGTLNTGGFGAANNVTRTGLGWNLVGNPYPSPIDWDAATGWTKTNVDNATYRHVNNATWAEYVGGVGANGGTRYIAGEQGFFVGVTTGFTTGTLSMTNEVRTHSTSTFFKDDISDIVRLEVSGNGYSNETVIRFLDNATPGFDGQWDAHKLFGIVPEAPAIYSSDNGMMSINTLPETNLVPVGVNVGVPGEFTITATETSEFADVILEDIVTGKFTDMKSESYPFYYDMDFDNRFILHFTPLSVPENTADMISIYSKNHDVCVSVPANTTGLVKVYNLMGQEEASASIMDITTRITLEKSAYYVVEVISEGSVVTKKVFVK